METRSTDIPFLSNIGLMLTYRCSVACPHCIVEAGPHRKDGMSLESALRWTSEASSYRGQHIKGLALTGGEPFIDLKYLKRISEYGRERGFVISAVTNAYWASSRKRALEILSALSSIHMISLSTDVYHLRCISFENIKNGISAATELGVPYTVAVCTDHEDAHPYKQIMQELLKITDAGSIRTSITFPAGRAKRSAGAFRYAVVSEPTVAACTMASSPVIFPDGNVMACIGPVMKLAHGHPLRLGNLNEKPLSSILDESEMNPILHAIRIWGPHKLIALIGRAHV